MDITDPWFNAWLDRVQLELGDECNPEHAWQLYKQGASAQEAAREIRAS